MMFKWKLGVLHNLQWLPTDSKIVQPGPTLPFPILSLLHTVLKHFIITSWRCHVLPWHIWCMPWCQPRMEGKCPNEWQTENERAGVDEQQHTHVRYHGQRLHLPQAEHRKATALRREPSFQFVPIICPKSEPGLLELISIQCCCPKPQNSCLGPRCSAQSMQRVSVRVPGSRKSTRPWTLVVKVGNRMQWQALEQFPLEKVAESSVNLTIGSVGWA